MTVAQSTLQSRWIGGVPADFWVLHRDFVQTFVKKQKLAAVAPEHLVADESTPVFAPVEGGKGEALALKILKPRPFPGGLRIPHLHVGDKVYQLDQKQWRDFSSTVMTSFRQKLENAQTVSFVQVMELSDALDSLG